MTRRGQSVLAGGLRQVAVGEAAECEGRRRVGARSARRRKGEGRAEGGEEARRERYWARERRRQVGWKRFLERARLYAAWRLRFVRWRGEEGGVPPEGFDAESVAMEALMVTGRTREAAGRAWRRDWRVLARAIRRLVDRLKHRREAWRTSSEPDLRWVVVDKEQETEETVRATDQVQDPGRRPGEELVEWERTEEFKAYLGRDRGAKDLVDCYCGNVTRRKEIAQLTGLSWKEVKNARERVRQKWKGFRRWEEERGRS